MVSNSPTAARHGTILLPPGSRYMGTVRMVGEAMDVQTTSTACGTVW
jgi:hypothetical protein